MSRGGDNLICHTKGGGINYRGEQLFNKYMKKFNNKKNLIYFFCNV